MVSDPSKALQPPKVERKMPEILSIAEVDLLLRQPKTDTPKGHPRQGNAGDALRDRHPCQ